MSAFFVYTVCLQDGIDGIDLYISVFKFSSVPCPTNLHCKCITVNIIFVCFQKLRCKTILFSEVISNITQMQPVELKIIIYPKNDYSVIIYTSSWIIKFVNQYNYVPNLYDFIASVEHKRSISEGELQMTKQATCNVK